MTLFRVNERSDFIALNALAGKITEYFVLIDSAGVADIFEKLYNRVL
jgi:hypothetical protein